MKLQIFKLLLIAGSLAVISYLAIENNFFSVGTVKAFGELTVDFHVPINGPIFTINNMVPGQIVDRNIDVTNSGLVARMVSVKGNRTGGVGADPKLETVLDLVIWDGATPIYGTGSPTGPKTLADFFTESSSAEGITLNILNPVGHKIYNFKVTFPSTSGNDFQNKSVIFDLIFGVITGDKVVINEVFYNVDSGHGLDCPKDRGIVSVNGNNVSLTIQGNGANSKNIVNINIKDVCSVSQFNSLIVQSVINSNANTGNNRSNRNNGRNSTTQTGSASATVNVSVAQAANIVANLCGNKLGINDEWVELYNPTDHDINLKNFSFTDNSGQATKINGNRILEAGKFVLVSKDNSTWNNWSEPSSVLKIPLGQQIGDGLDNGGDQLILKDASGQIVDALSWGSDTSIFNLAGVVAGHSLERLVPGFDTDLASDFINISPPTPGL